MQWYWVRVHCAFPLAFLNQYFLYELPKLVINMEVSLCAISSYSPASSSFLSPRCPCVRLLRKEFLGSGHNLRPPGLRSTTQCRKLVGFRFHFCSKTRSVLLRASLHSQFAVFVVATAAVSAALLIVFLNNSKPKTRTQDMQVFSGSIAA